MHTYITELCLAGLDIKKVQYLAGHSTVQMTLDVYAAVACNRPEDLSPAIRAHFAGARPAMTG
jgi:site-specific recombinase XerD